MKRTSEKDNENENRKERAWELNTCLQIRPGLSYFMCIKVFTRITTG